MFGSARRGKGVRGLGTGLWCHMLQGIKKLENKLYFGEAKVIGRGNVGEVSSMGRVGWE